MLRLVSYDSPFVQLSSLHVREMCVLLLNNISHMLSASVIKKSFAELKLKIIIHFITAVCSLPSSSSWCFAVCCILRWNSSKEKGFKLFGA